MYTKRCQVLNSFEDKMLFGKYYGKRIMNIPRGYLRWMKENGYITCTQLFKPKFKKSVLTTRGYSRIVMLRYEEVTYGMC